jgi:hypothetical protein
MSSSRLDLLSSDYVDELDVQVAALEIRAQRRFQQERDLYRHSVGIATAKLQQYCLGLVLAQRGPNDAIYSVVEEAAAKSGLPVNLWTTREVKQVWDEIIIMLRVRPMAGPASANFADFQNFAYDASSDGTEHPKPRQSSAKQEHGEIGAPRKRGGARSSWTSRAGMDEHETSPPPVVQTYGIDMPIRGGGKTGYDIDGALARAGQDVEDPRASQGKNRFKYQSQGEIHAEMQRVAKMAEEAAAARAAADREEDARLEIEIEKQRREDAEIAERERAARAKEDEAKAAGTLNPIQQMEMDEAREMFRGNLSDEDQKILAEAKKELGEDIMQWGFAETKKVLKWLLTGVREQGASVPEAQG